MAGRALRPGTPWTCRAAQCARIAASLEGAQCTCRCCRSASDACSSALNVATSTSVGWIASDTRATAACVEHGRELVRVGPAAPHSYARQDKAAARTARLLCRDCIKAAHWGVTAVSARQQQLCGAALGPSDRCSSNASRHPDSKHEALHRRCCAAARPRLLRPAASPAAPRP